MYDHFLAIYGAKKMAEKYLHGFIAGVRSLAAEAATRCAVFGALLRVLEGAAAMEAEEAALCCALYASLQHAAFSSSAREAACLEQADGTVTVAPAAAQRAVRVCFSRLEHRRPEALRRMEAAAQGVQN